MFQVCFQRIPPGTSLVGNRKSPRLAARITVRCNAARSLAKPQERRSIGREKQPQVKARRPCFLGLRAQSKAEALRTRGDAAHRKQSRHPIPTGLFFAVFPK